LCKLALCRFRLLATVSYIPRQFHQYVFTGSSISFPENFLLSIDHIPIVTMSDLASINSATLGTSMPVVTLPDGTKAQTGTIAALLINIRTYNEAHVQGDTTLLKELEEKFKLAIPLLKKVGFFDLFTPDEWQAGTNEGRKLVGRLAMGTGA